MMTDEYPLVAEGKTKKVFDMGDGMAKFYSKDDITAGDGKKHDVIEGKGALANRTACNMFRLLKSKGIPAAFERQLDERSFIGPRCDMLPYEVVVRREAHGSYLERYPHAAKGERFEILKVEFFLKTKDRDWKGRSLVCDDPLIAFESGRVDLYNPHRPREGQAPFLSLDESEVFTQADEKALLDEMAEIARSSFLILEIAFGRLGYNYVDFKVEFGVWRGKLLLADTIDNDSGRLLLDGRYQDKQFYRDGGSVIETKSRYELVAGLTDRFGR